jgi:hypothetical protein
LANSIGDGAQVPLVLPQLLFSVLAVIDAVSMQQRGDGSTPVITAFL